MQILTLIDSVTAPTTDHNTRVTQGTSTLKQISVGGSRGYYNHTTLAQRDRQSRQRVTVLHAVTPSTQDHGTEVTALHSVTAPTTDHNTEVTQTTSTKQQISVGGARGYYQHQQQIISGGANGYYQLLQLIQPASNANPSGTSSGVQFFFVT